MGPMYTVTPYILEYEKGKIFIINFSWILLMKVKNCDNIISAEKIKMLIKLDMKGGKWEICLFSKSEE